MHAGYLESYQNIEAACFMHKYMFSQNGSGSSVDDSMEKQGVMNRAQSGDCPKTRTGSWCGSTLGLGSRASLICVSRARTHTHTQYSLVTMDLRKATIINLLGFLPSFWSFFSNLHTFHIYYNLVNPRTAIALPQPVADPSGMVKTKETFKCLSFHSWK
jgi:hypothetical protein